MKQLRAHLFIVVTILTIYGLLALWFERTDAQQHEDDFNAQQARQIQLSAQSRYEWLPGEMAALANGTLALGRDMQRKLIVWSTAYSGSRRLTVARSAPDSESKTTIALMRGPLLVLGILLAVALLVSGSLIYLNRQRHLMRLVTERTQAMEHLTNQLEQRVAERTAELEHERAQLKTILEAMTDGVVFRQGANIIYTNSRMHDLIGYTRDELLADPQAIFKAISCPIDRTASSSTHHELQGIWRAEGQLKRRNGSLLDVSIYMAEVRNPDDQPIGMIEIIRDISREKALHRQRDSFITNAAHELRNPLANLKTRLYLLKRQPEKLHEHLEIVDMAADHMTELVQDLVDMAQFSKGDIQLNRRTLDLRHILRASLSIQEQHAYRVRVSVTQSLPDHPIPIYADHQRLMQTFSNLIANAIQSTTPDGQVEVSMLLPNTSAREWVTVQIHDNGPALDQEQLAFIFEPFFRPSIGSVKRTGMDLALSRHIIEEHGGTISVASQPTLGTTFTVRLPLHQSEPNKSN